MYYIYERKGGVRRGTWCSHGGEEKSKQNLSFKTSITDPFGSYKSRQENNIEVPETNSIKNVNWIKLVRDKVQYQNFMKTIKNFRLLIDEIFLIYSTSVNFQDTAFGVRYEVEFVLCLCCSKCPCI
jgi:hypothetical protein